MDDLAEKGARRTAQRSCREACRRDAVAGEFQSMRRATTNARPSTLARPSGRRFRRALSCNKVRIPPNQVEFTSRRAAVRGRRDRALRKKVIGRSRAAFPDGFRGGSVLRRLMRTLAMFHQPARQHSGRIFLHPEIEQRANFLPEIGGMAKARKLVTLQGVARCREKELPRRLGSVVVHEGLLGEIGAR